MLLMGGTQTHLPGLHTVICRNRTLQLSFCPFPSVFYALINDSTNLFSTSHRSPEGCSSPAGILCQCAMTSEWAHGLLPLDSVPNSEIGLCLQGGSPTMVGFFSCSLQIPLALRMENVSCFSRAVNTLVVACLWGGLECL